MSADTTPLTWQEMHERLYRLNEQHVRDLLARQELLTVLEDVCNMNIAELNKPLIKRARAAIQKWSQK